MKTTKQITILVCNLLLASLATAQAQAPVITTPPQDQYVPIGYGSNATFTVTVSNAPPLAYQWQKDGANLANATNATLVIPNAGTNDVGEYRVVVSNGDGSVTSSPPAVLTVYTSLAISTLAGQAGSSGSADGTNGTARFYNPNGVAVDTNGNIYVADKGNFTIRRITPEGTVTTLAGRAGTSGSTDGLGTNALFASPTRLAVDSAGNLWVADLLSIRKMTPAGEVSTVAGQACTGIDVDDAGNVYVADHWSHIIRKMTPDGTVTTLAGRAGVPGSIDGVGTNALFYFPSDVAVDSNGNVYVADSENYTIRKISPDGTVLTVAGQAGQNGFTDGRAPNARFGGVWVEFQEVGPTGVTVDRAGNLYVADTYNSTIRKLTPDGLVVTVAGFARNSRSTDGSGGNARFYYPSDLAVDRAGTVYVADTRNHTVRKGVPYTGQIIILSPPQDRNVTVTYSSNLFTPVVCGLPPLTYEWRKNGMNLPGATNSTLLLPNVASNDSGAYSVVISHPGESVTSTPPATLTVSPALSVITLAGRADVPGSADGLGKEARFGWPWGLALDSAGNVYAADSEYQTIRKLTPRGMVTTVAGQAGEYGTDDGLGNVARFQDPAGVAADSKGNLYVAD